MWDAEQLYDVVIVGGGPAGLSAALYMARAKYRVLVMEKEKIGGQITITSEIVNYPGVKKTSGKELTESMRQQAEAFGAEFAIGEVMSMELGEDIKILHTTNGDKKALGVVISTGANPRKLGFKGEKEFQGRGVAYCATCDGEFFTGMEVFVIGGGFAAVEEGMFLTQYAKKVTLIVREEDFTCARTVSDQLKRNEKISVIFQTEIMEVKGESMVSFARFKNNETGEEWTYESEEGFGVFVFAGYVPNTGWLNGDVELDPYGYVVTDVNQKTNLDGVYAAGDLCVKNLRQVVTAVSDGAVAAVSMEKHVAALHDRLEIPDLVKKQADLSRLEAAGEVGGAAGAGGVAGRAGGEAVGGAEVTGRAGGEAVGDGGGTVEAAGHYGASASGSHDDDNRFLNSEIRAQLEGLFPKFENKVIIRAWLDDSPLSGEMKGFLGELEGISDNVVWEEGDSSGSGNSSASNSRLLPSIELCHADGSSSGIQFHGVPGGHEFNSFIIALYNTAGPGQQTDPSVEEKLSSIQNDINVKVMISLSCTMCPEVVMAAQKAASISAHITAEMIDLMHYPDLKQKYRIMSVPCMVVNDEAVYFGKKSLEEVTDILLETGNALPV